MVGDAESVADLLPVNVGKWDSAAPQVASASPLCTMAIWQHNVTVVGNLVGLDTNWRRRLNSHPSSRIQALVIRSVIAVSVITAMNHSGFMKHDVGLGVVADFVCRRPGFPFGAVPTRWRPSLDHVVTAFDDMQCDGTCQRLSSSFGFGGEFILRLLLRLSCTMEGHPDVEGQMVDQRPLTLYVLVLFHSRISTIPPRASSPTLSGCAQRSSKP